MEEHVRHRVLFAALEDGLHAHLLIELLVLGAHAAGGGVQHDVHLAAQVFKGAGHRDVQGVKFPLVRAAHQVQIVLDIVGAHHVVLPQGPDGQGGGQIGDAHQLHVALHGHAVRQTLSYGAVARHAYSNLCHENVLRFKKFRCFCANTSTREIVAFVPLFVNLKCKVSCIFYHSN